MFGRRGTEATINIQLTDNFLNWEKNLFPLSVFRVSILIYDRIWFIKISRAPLYIFFSFTITSRENIIHVVRNRGHLVTYPEFHN